MFEKVGDATLPLTLVSAARLDIEQQRHVPGATAPHHAVVETVVESPHDGSRIELDHVGFRNSGRRGGREGLGKGRSEAEHGNNERG